MVWNPVAVVLWGVLTIPLGWPGVALFVAGLIQGTLYMRVVSYG